MERKRTTRYLASLLIVSFVLLAPMLFAQPEPIVKEIEINGLRTVTEQTVLDILKSKVGSPLDRENIKVDIEAIDRLGYFTGDISAKDEPADDGVKLVFTVIESPVIDAITVIGNREFTNKKVLAEISYEPGDILPSNGVGEIKTAVNALYIRSGYYGTGITIDEISTDDDSVALQIIIDEGSGKKSLVKKVRFVGRESFSAFRLKMYMATKGSSVFLKRYYDDGMFKDDLESLKAFYFSKGYFDAQVTPGEFSSDEKKGSIIPTVIIEEGIRYKLGTISAQGNTLFSNEEILTHFEHMRDKFFSFAAFDRGIWSVTRMYGDEGYILATMSPEYLRNPNAGNVDIILNIDEGEAIYIGNVELRVVPRPEPSGIEFLEGIIHKLSPPIKEEALETIRDREITLKPGMLYQRFQEVRTIRRLKDVRVFSEVKIHRELTDSPNVQDVVIDLQREIAGNIGFGVGVGDVTGGFGFVSYTEPNLFGEAKRLTAAAQIGSDQLEFKFSLLDRHYHDTDYSVRHSIFRDQIDRGDYEETRAGYNFEVGKPLDVEIGKSIKEYFNEFLNPKHIPENTEEIIQAYVKMRFEYASFHEDHDEDFEEDFDSYPIAAIRFRVVDDTRDDRLWATEGYDRSAGLELGYADGPLVKFTGYYAGYWEVRKGLVLAQRLKFGLLPYDPDTVGITERLYMGGTDDLRGFEYRGVEPKDNDNDDVPIGGSTKLLSQTELRFPIFKQLKGLVFLDAGSLGDSAFSLRSPRFSAGFGFVLNLPMANINIYIAEALNEKSGDKTQTVHFKISSSF